MKLLIRSDVQRALSMREAVEIIKLAFAELSTGQADSPLRTAIAQPNHDGVTLFMPAYLSQCDALAVKIASIHNRNPERGLPRIHALVVAIDPATGQPLAVMEGGYLTALRTGAATGAATDLLARADAETAAIIGAGRQARTQLLAVAAVRTIKRVWIYSRLRQSAEAMIAELQPQLATIELLVADTSTQAVRDADVICAATNSRTPVFNGEDLKPGAHVNGTGSYTHEMQEVDFATLRRASKIVVDERKAALAEAGDLIVAFNRGELRLEDIYAELGEIAAGLKPGRQRDDEITYFKSVGNAVQDAAVAQAIYQEALKENLGVEFDLFN
ncbi:MAG: ornithine cyclodeaminase family protein [Acidobacteriota bacterium]|nr:ornithine cyclodeaminase family protein [Acidobacteriota bacterium]